MTTGIFGGQPITNTNQIPGFDPQSFYSLGNYGANAASSATGNGLGFNTGTFQGVSSALGGLTGLAQLYGMFQSLGLQRDAFKFSQEGTRRNFNASATAFNNAVDDQHAARSAYARVNGGGFDSLADYGNRKVKNWEG